MSVREAAMALCDRITAYLVSGGLFNPELMDHEKVCALLRDCRDALDADEDARDAARYRWLRSTQRTCFSDGGIGATGSMLDAAIDAAMQEPRK